MRRHFKVIDMLCDGDRGEFMRLAREPKNTVDSLWTWLRAHGYQVSRSSVGRFLAYADSRPSILEQGARAVSGQTVVIEVHTPGNVVVREAGSGSKAD